MDQRDLPRSVWCTVGDVSMGASSTYLLYRIEETLRVYNPTESGIGSNKALDYWPY